MFDLLQRLGVDAGGYDRWGIAFEGASSAIAWVLIAAALAALVLWNASSTRELASRRLRWFLIAWQALIMALLIAVMLRPSIRLTKVAKIKDRVVALIDSSASMGLPAGDGDMSRAEQAARFLESESGFFDDLADDFALFYMSFDSSTKDLGGRPGGPVDSQGEATDILAALSSLGASGAPLAGVVAISDGADTSRLGRLFQEGGRGGELAALLSDFPAPVNTVALGAGVRVKDLGIVSAVHDDYGFVHNPFEVRVEVRSEGKVAPQAPVIFKQGGKVLASKTIRFKPGQTRASATLSFTPRQVGEFMFSVEIPAAPGEVTEANNLVRFPLKVLRDKVRVLYIVGSPSWDERFLRRVLKKNPSVDLVCFYILRQISDDTNASENEMSLIRFPTKELFMDELDTFDLLIWQNFQGRPYMFGEYGMYMESLNRFVKERGGGLLMIGGPRAFHGRGVMDPKLIDLLPIAPSNAIPNYEKTDFKLEITPAGLRHPIMEINDGGQGVAEAWDNLPELSSINHVGKLVPGALVLAAHPFARGDGGKAPLVAVREAGAGRVMAVMTDGSWQWNLPAVGEGVSNKSYQRFWENSMRWLLRDPELRLITVSADRGRLAPGDEVTLSIEALDETYNPTDEADVKVEVVQEPEGSNLVLPEPARMGIGKYRLTVKPDVPGGYRVRASAAMGGRPLGFDEEIFEVGARSAEWAEVMPRPEILEEISRATGGAAIDAKGDPDDFKFKSAGKEQVIGQKDLPMWDNWYVYFICFGMMTLGWYVRRRWGLL